MSLDSRDYPAGNRNRLYERLLQVSVFPNESQPAGKVDLPGTVLKDESVGFIQGDGEGDQRSTRGVGKISHRLFVLHTLSLPSSPLDSFEISSLSTITAVIRG